MAKKKQEQEVHSPIENVDASFNKAEQFIENNLSLVGIILGAILLLGAGVWGYQNFISEPNELEAQNAIYPAQQYFEADSLKLALNGGGGNPGFLQVADEYSSTKAGNLANYYAGVCYLNLGQFDKAIEYLEQYSGNDGVISVYATGNIGDAFHELNQPEEALEYYTKASNMEGNDFTTPYYINKAAKTAEMLGEWSTALKMYKRLRDDFPNSDPARDVEKFITYCENQADRG